MKIATLSIVVPTKGCVNKCKFCVSRMHDNDYESCFDPIQIEKRIKWSVMNGVNTCILTGTGEALQNTGFLAKLLEIFEKLDHPFPNVELQTSGALLNKKIQSGPFSREISYPNIDLLKKLRVNTISLSVSDLFHYERNMEIIGVPLALSFTLDEICSLIKSQGFNLRLSLNMTNSYDSADPQMILNECKDLGADQITFRELYHNHDNTPQSKWVRENECSFMTMAKIKEHISGKKIAGGFIEKGCGTPLYKLPFGSTAYSIDGMSVVIDTNCMGKDPEETLKYIILRENGKLYSQWDDNGSLIF